MAKEKKGQKFGRNRDRNPSSKLQAKRTERNKRENAERAHSLKMQQMQAGGKTEEVYKGLQPKVNAAAKFVNACMRLGDMRRARIRQQRMM